jgi:predicted RNA-binding Zn-ribbon protein involved in translation (DUF1610 family)
MAISFECPRCGKKLNAPDTAVGKSSICPGCGGPVTCPEPVYDAEVIETNPLDAAGVDPNADLGDDEPYALIDPQPPTDASTESRRPCPMCGEMILTTAVKCRFCGEIFDPTLKESKTRKYGPGSERLTGGDIAIALVCSGIGCITGLVWMIQGRPKGLKMFGLSVVADIVKAVLLAIFFQVSQEGGAGL